jgi:hypothetical protein
VQKHAMALGYFILAVLCILAGSQTLNGLRVLLLLAALVAALAGCGFLLSACAVQLYAGKKWLIQMFRLAQQPPQYRVDSREEQTV